MNRRSTQLSIQWLLISLGWLVLPLASRADTTSFSGATEITGLPWTISAPGVYYLSQSFARNDLSTNAITVNASGVTIDFNGNTISNVAAGSGVLASGIYAPACSRLTVRNGVIRGYTYGIYAAAGGYGHLIENMRVIESTSWGVRLEATGSVVRRCQTYKIGGSTQPGYATSVGIGLLGSNNTVVDCDVSELILTIGSATAGIYASGTALVMGNRVDRVRYGVYLDGSGSGKYRDNLCAASVTIPYTGGIDALNN